MNQHTFSVCRGERGSALLVAMFFGLIAGMVSVGAVLIIQQQIHDSTREVNQAVARKLAEGGAERALSWLTLPANMTATALPMSVVSYTVPEGTVNVAMDWINGSLTSSSTVRGVKAVSKVLYKAKVVTTIAPIQVQQVTHCGIVTDWDITGNGNADLLGLAALDVHSNDLFNIQNIHSIIQNTVSSTVATAALQAVKTGPVPTKLQSPNVQIPLLNWSLYEAEAKAATFTYKDSTQGNKSITRSNWFATASDFTNVVNVAPNHSIAVTAPVYIKQGPLSCGSFTIDGGPLIVEGDINIRVTGQGVVSITNTAAWPIAIAWKGGQLYFGGNSVSTITNWIYSESGGYVDFQGTSFKLQGGIMLRGKPAGGYPSLNLNGTPNISLAQMDQTMLVTYFLAPGNTVTQANFTIYAWQ